MYGFRWITGLVDFEFVSGTLARTVDNPCRPGWLWGRYRCYQFITSPNDLTHHEANRKCGELSAELFQPSFNSQEEFETNRDLIARAIDSADSKTFPRQAWIGKLPSCKHNCALLFSFCVCYSIQCIPGFFIDRFFWRLR